jgi:hypothetical protein
MFPNTSHESLPKPIKIFKNNIVRNKISLCDIKFQSRIYKKKYVSEIKYPQVHMQIII